MQTEGLDSILIVYLFIVYLHISLVYVIGCTGLGTDKTILRIVISAIVMMAVDATRTCKYTMKTSVVIDLKPLT